MSSIFLKKNLNNDFFDIGKRLKEVREALKLTLDRIHEVSGTARSYIAEFERGRKLPSAKYLLCLSEKYDVNLNYIFKGSGRMFVHQDDSPAGRTNSFDFGKHNQEINEMLVCISGIPHALYVILGCFAEYKVIYKEIIDRYMESSSNDKKIES